MNPVVSPKLIQAELNVWYKYIELTLIFCVGLIKFKYTETSLYIIDLDSPKHFSTA
jgi:hypothetical protein